jgi:hypothetical protein
MVSNLAVFVLATSWILGMTEHYSNTSGSGDEALWCPFGMSCLAKGHGIAWPSWLTACIHAASLFASHPRKAIVHLFGLLFSSVAGWGGTHVVLRIFVIIMGRHC